MKVLTTCSRWPPLLTDLPTKLLLERTKLYSWPDKESLQFVWQRQFVRAVWSLAGAIRCLLTNSRPNLVLNLRLNSHNKIRDENKLFIRSNSLSHLSWLLTRLLWVDIHVWTPADRVASMRRDRRCCHLVRLYSSLLLFIAKCVMWDASSGHFLSCCL